MRLYPPFVDIRPISTTTARKLFFPIVLGLLVLLGYLPALHTAFLADDFILLSQAQIKYSGLSIFAVSPYWWFYRPLSALVWQYTFKLFGYHPLGYHLFSLGLHWASSLLIVALVRRFTTHSTLLAPGAGLLFALLPLHPETVVWLASQFDLLATVCYLATLCCLLLAWERRSIPFYLLALGAYQLSLWSKESAFTLPIIVVMFGLALRDRPRPRILIGGTLPFALLLGINLLQRYLVWGRIGGYLNAPSDYPSFIWDHLAGTLAVLVGPLNRLLLPAYLRQLWMLGMAALLVAGLMAGYNQRLILLALGWLLITLLPAINILPVAADLEGSRFLYLPAVGFCMGLVALIDAVAKRFVAREPQRASAAAIMMLGALYFGVLRIHMQPWPIAGQAAIDILQDLHRLIPSFAPGSKLQTLGLPDKYNGAFVLRNGLDWAFLERYGSRPAVEQVAQFAPLAYGRNAKDIFQVAFAFDPGIEGWRIVQARGVTALSHQEPPVPAGGISWDFNSCAAIATWKPRRAAVACTQAAGAEIRPVNEDAYLGSPALDLAKAGWVEVIVDMARPRQAAPGAVAQLFWRTAAMDGWDEKRSVSINLPPDDRTLRYHFFVPPDATGQPVSQLRLDPVNTTDTILIERLAIRVIQ
ncbi:MAG: hypothetical protein ACJ8CR_16640 [Roseiflexaceae bacterium]